MPHVRSYSAGAPCWFELGTTDQKAANHFYTSLFGWSLEEHPIGDAGMYSMYKLDAHDVAAAYTLMPDMLAQGIPPHWMVYFCVNRVDDAAEAVAELGGAVVQPGFDVFDYGRMSVCRDPEGAVFSLWQPGTHPGATVFGDVNSVCWAELACRQSATAVEFYTRLLGWEIKPSTQGMPYTEFAVDGQPCGGILQMDTQFEGVPAHWGIYFLVADCDAAADSIRRLGGGIRHGPFDAPNVGRIALAHDGQGAMFSIIKLTNA